MLKQDVIKLIKENQYLKIELMQHNKKSQYTIEKWLNENNSSLTEFSNLGIIKKHLQIEDITELLNTI